jgi:Copper binding proteins, plastocyanin/azurin family
MRTLALLLLLLAFGALGLAACGDDDDDGSAAAPETTGPNEEPIYPEVDLSTPPGSDPAYSETDVAALAGLVTIDFHNRQSISHDVKIEDSEGEVLGGTNRVSSRTTTASVDLEPGTYTFFCSVPGHREAGMEGTLTVE